LVAELKTRKFFAWGSSQITLNFTFKDGDRDIGNIDPPIKHRYPLPETWRV
jgi:hypothetical protein